MIRSTSAIFLLILLFVGIGPGCNKDREQVQKLAKEVQEAEARTYSDDSAFAAVPLKTDSAISDTSKASSFANETENDSVVNVSNGPAEVSVPDSKPKIEAPIAVEKSMPPRIVEGYTIQIGSSIDRTYSENIAQQYVDRGYQAYVSEIDVEEIAHFRIRIGSFETIAEARKMGDDLQAKYGINYWVDKNLK